MAYYRVLQDMGFPGRWYLDDPVLPSGEMISPWSFVGRGPLVFEQPLLVPLLRAGVPMDFTEVEFGMPVVSERLKGMFERLAPGADQFIPVTVAGQQGPYYILNVLPVIECVDEERSSFRRFKEDDPVRPDLAGHFDVIEKLVIDERRAGGALLFRVSRSEGDLVAHESIKKGFEEIAATGARFVPMGVGVLDKEFWV